MLTVATTTTASPPFPNPTSSPNPTSDPSLATTTVPVAAEPRAVASIAGLITDVGSATYDAGAQPADVIEPVLLSIPGIGVENASVVPVGVLPDGRFEVPEARMVGWYRFGPAPADDGVTVLAAHLNYDGVNGVFRRLTDVDIDDQVTVTTADGQTRTYRVTERRVIDKNQLPPDEIWARSGAPRLVLITCGGRYDAERRSYDDNVVVFAVPI